ncbi:MAG: MinD/ParA family protein [Deltaproteobacteria bacterium]|nr:MinD/ParA family protein [Deltaproteobacteria bacterium]
MKTVAISSGKGGVGKTTVAVNLGIALSKAGKRVLLFDADLGLANVDILLGMSAEHTLADVLDESVSMESVLLKAPGGLTVLPAGSGILRLERLSPTQRVRLTKKLHDISRDYDLLLLDTGAGLTENVLFFASTADEVLMVTTPEPTALTDAYALIKILTTNYAVESIQLLVNEATRGAQGREIHAKLNGVAQRFLNRQLGYLGHIPSDPEVENAIKARTPLVVAKPSCPAAQAIHSVARHFDSVFVLEPRRRVTDMWKALMEPRSQTIK